MVLLSYLPTFQLLHLGGQHAAEHDIHTQFRRYIGQRDLQILSTSPSIATSYSIPIHRLPMHVRPLRHVSIELGGLEEPP